MRSARCKPPCERGSALFLSLILLIAFTLLGTSLAAAYQMQQRVQSNQERVASATQAANAALAEAERWMFEQVADRPPVACSEFCSSDNPVWVHLHVPADIQHLDQTWWQAHAQASNAGSGNGHWLIAELEAPGAEMDPLQTPTGLYRVLALASDQHGVALAVTESILVRPWMDPPPAESLPSGRPVERFCRETGRYPCGRVAWRQLR